MFTIKNFFIYLLLVKVFAVELKPAIVQDALFRGKTLLINPGCLCF